MSARIMLLNPWGVDYADEVGLNVIGSFVRPDTDLACVNLTGKARPVPWPVAEGLEPAVELAKKAEADGFDAIINGCAGDPYLDDLRAAVSIPVVGIAETILRNARSRGKKICILDRLLPEEYTALIPNNGPDKFDFWNAKAASYGLTPDLYSIRKVRIATHPGVDSLEPMTREGSTELRELMFQSFVDSLHDDGLRQTKAAADEDGAEAVFFACNFWSTPIAALGRDATQFGATMINPLGSAATFAEHLVISAA
jgi:allantoin racemase